MLRPESVASQDAHAFPGFVAHKPFRIADLHSRKSFFDRIDWTTGRVQGTDRSWGALGAANA